MPKKRLSQDRAGSLLHTVLSGPSRWSHRIAWALWWLTFLSLVMGAFVTTYDAGMAIPDWPNTFGYPLVFYPIHNWFKTCDVFLAHSHRLLADLAGVLSICLVVLLWKTQNRTLRWLGITGVVLFLFEALLGGLRIVVGDIVLANIHGCVAPLIFAFVTILVAVTKPWQGPGESAEKDRAAFAPVSSVDVQERARQKSASGPVREKKGTPERAGDRSRLSLAMFVGLVYLQMIVGAQLRHIPPTLSPLWPYVWTIVHLVIAGLIGLMVVGGWLYFRWPAIGTASRRWVVIISVIYVIQIICGLLTWVVNYNFPAWFLDYICAIHYTVNEYSALQTVITTTNAVTASLLFAASVVLLIVVVREERLREGG